MKKLIIIMLSVIVLFKLLPVVASSVVIPSEAIRMRVIANSNTDYDQKIKGEVSKELQKSMYHLLKNTKSIYEAREIIKNNIKSLDKDLALTLTRLDYDLDYEINYGLNYFPNKEYKGVNYEEGNYESLVVTLGKGNGDNWWCVLFPPLCLLEAEENDKLEYKFFVKELLDKYL